MTREPEHMQDKAFLRECITSGQLSSGRNVGQFALELMQNFASPDPELRDDLTYRLMGMLIVRGQLDFPDHEKLLRMATDAEHLFLGIGESGTDTVFMRSFSALMVPLLLVHGEHAHGFDTLEVEEVANRLLRYVASERDWRGYVPNKGLAHSVAHTADALMACGTYSSANTELGDRMLQGIKDLAMVPYPLGYLEDDRLAFAAFSIMQNNQISAARIQRWLDSFQLANDQDNDGDETLCGANAEHFLRVSIFGSYMMIKPVPGWRASSKHWLGLISIFSNNPHLPGELGISSLGLCFGSVPGGERTSSLLRGYTQEQQARALYIIIRLFRCVSSVA